MPDVCEFIRPIPYWWLFPSSHVRKPSQLGPRQSSSSPPGGTVLEPGAPGPHLELLLLPPGRGKASYTRWGGLGGVALLYSEFQ